MMGAEPRATSREYAGNRDIITLLRDEIADDVADVRRFTRFYTRYMGILNRHLPGTGSSITEARVLFEISTGDGPRANIIAESLGIDPAYLSRILKRFEKRGLIRRQTDPRDRRGLRLALTEAGENAAHDLVARYNANLATKLEQLSYDERQNLVLHLRQARSLLETKAALRPGAILREPRCGDLGWIIHRQARLCFAEFGWDETFEHVVIEILAGYLGGARPGRDRCWVADRGGAVIGSVFLQHRDDETAWLRLLYVEPSARGTGLGGLLVDTCITEARRRGYRRLTLWTMNILNAARTLYERHGFVLTDETPVRQFDQDLVNLTYSLDLHPTNASLLGV